MKRTGRCRITDTGRVRVCVGVCVYFPLTHSKSADRVPTLFLAYSDSEAAPQLRGTVAGPRKMGVTSAVSDESVAGDSGVYEPSERKYEQFCFFFLVKFLLNVSQ